MYDLLSPIGFGKLVVEFQNNQHMSMRTNFYIYLYLIILFSGSISVETDNLLQRLKRTLPPGEEPVKLFSLNFDVDVCNARLLGDLEGNLMF